MLRRIIGITGVSVWAGLIAVVVGFQVSANGEEMFKDLPDGWKVEKFFEVPKEQIAAFSQKLGGRIKSLTNTIITIGGNRLQVNVVCCQTIRDAEKVYNAIVETHDGVTASAVRDGKIVLEFAKTDNVELMHQASRGLGLEKAWLDSIAGGTIKRIPADWRIEKSFVVSREQSDAIGKKLGGRIRNLSNTIFSVQGRRFQVNVIECVSQAAAEKIYQRIAEIKGDPAFCLKLGNKVVEFVGDDVSLAKRAPNELGIGSASGDTRGEADELDINAKVARLNINRAGPDKVRELFGEPIEYLWGNETFEKDNLPSTYLLKYPNGFSVLMSGGKVKELRHTRPGYRFRDKFQVGDSLEEVLKVVGRPKETIMGESMPSIARDRVLYKDIDGTAGYCYYGHNRRGVRLFFRDYKVSALYVTKNDFSGRRGARDAGKVPAASARGTAEKPLDSDIETIAKELVELLAKGDYATAVENFDRTMKSALPAEKLEEVWNGLITQFGPLKEQLGVRREKILQYDVIFVTCKFERAVLDAKVVFNRKKQVSGLFFVPSL